MEIQEKIREQAFKQQEVFKDMRDFVERQEILDERSSVAAKQFDPATVVLPSVRNANNCDQDAAFAKSCGNKLFEEGKYREALQQYENGLCASDQVLKAECHFNIGLCHEKLNNEKSALEDFEIAVELDPLYDKAKQKLAKLHIKNERFSEALSLLESCANDDHKLDEDIEMCRANAESSEEEIAFNQKIGQATEQQISVLTDKENDQPCEREQRSGVQKSGAELPQKVEDQVPQNPTSIGPNASPLEFYTAFRQSCRSGCVASLCAGLKTSVLADYFYELRKQITFSDFEALIAACAAPDEMSVAKRVNLLYAISDVSEFERLCKMMPSSQIEILQNTLNALQHEAGAEPHEKSRELAERIQTVRESWLTAPNSK